MPLPSSPLRFDHLQDDLRNERESPAAFWNYGNEDFIGDVVAISARTQCCNLIKFLAVPNMM